MIIIYLIAELLKKQKNQDSIIQDILFKIKSNSLV